MNELPLVRGRPPATPDEVDRAEWMFYLSYLRRGMTAFDVGAFVGELTLLFSRFVGGDGRVHAFEAAPASFSRLANVIESARRDNVVLNRLAVGERDGFASLHVFDDDYLSWSSLADRPLADYGISVRPVAVEDVEAVSLDTYCSSRGIERIDLLKIDVEGAEYQVLLGARALLEEKRIACCVFEFGQTTFDMGNSPEEIAGYLERLGYGVRNIVSGDSVFPGRESAATAAFSMHVAEPK